MSKLRELMEGADSIAITGHVRPDGDCVGSVLSVYRFAKKLFPQAQVDVYLESMPQRFLYMAGSDEVITDYPDRAPYDLFVMLDCGDLDRIGKAEKYFRQAKRTLCIDHHVSSRGIADVNVIRPETGSNSEILYELMEEEAMDRELAVCLYTGIVHDTGVFQFKSTSPRTMEIGGRLMGYGVPFSEIIQDSFFMKSYIQNQVMGRVLMESILVCDKKCIVGIMRLKDMKFYGVTGEDMDGIIDQLRNTAGVEVSIFLYEMEPSVFKVSMRSRDIVDVSAIAVAFGGGGHVRAAGCTVAGSVYDVINSITYHVERQLAENAERDTGRPAAVREN